MEVHLAYKCARRAYRRAGTRRPPALRAAALSKVMGVLMFSAVLVLVGNVIADLLYAVCDPRIRLD